MFAFEMQKLVKKYLCLWVCVCCGGGGLCSGSYKACGTAYLSFVMTYVLCIMYKIQYNIMCDLN